MYMNWDKFYKAIRKEFEKYVEEQKQSACPDCANFKSKEERNCQTCQESLYNKCGPCINFSAWKPIEMPWKSVEAPKCEECRYSAENDKCLKCLDFWKSWLRRTDGLCGPKGRWFQPDRRREERRKK